jgi:hypothetical protein
MSGPHARDHLRKHSKEAEGWQGWRGTAVRNSKKSAPRVPMPARKRHACRCLRGSEAPRSTPPRTQTHRHRHKSGLRHDTNAEVVEKDGFLLLLPQKEGRRLHPPQRKAASSTHPSGRPPPPPHLEGYPLEGAADTCRRRTSPASHRQLVRAMLVSRDALCLLHQQRPVPLVLEFRRVARMHRHLMYAHVCVCARARTRARAHAWVV